MHFSCFFFILYAYFYDYKFPSCIPSTIQTWHHLHGCDCLFFVGCTANIYICTLQVLFLVPVFYFNMTETAFNDNPKSITAFFGFFPLSTTSISLISRFRERTVHFPPIAILLVVAQTYTPCRLRLATQIAYCLGKWCVIKGERNLSSHVRFAENEKDDDDEVTQGKPVFISFSIFNVNCMAWG